MDKYKVYMNYVKDSDNNEKFLVLRQDKNEVIIPYHKLKRVADSMKTMLLEMEVDNAKN